MSADLERELELARPTFPEPGDAAERRARATLGLSSDGVRPRRWLSGRSMRGGRAYVIAATLLIGATGAAIAGGLVGTGGGGAATGSSPSLSFAPGEIVARGVDRFGPPTVGVDGDGTVILAWESEGEVWERSRPRGGQWADPRRLDDPAGGRSGGVSLAVAPTGDAVVVWRTKTDGEVLEELFELPSGAPAGSLRKRAGQSWSVRAAVRASDGTWAPPQPISAETSKINEVRTPRIGISSSGEAIVTWKRNGAVRARAYDPAVGWAPAATVAGRDLQPGNPGVAVGPGGEATIAWAQGVSSDTPEVAASDLRPDGSWAEPRVVGPGISGRQRPPSISIGLSGDRTMVWLPNTRSRGDHSKIAGAVFQDERWTASDPPLDLGSEAGIADIGPVVATDANGEAVVLGERITSDGAQILGPKGVVVSELGEDGWSPGRLISPTSRWAPLVVADANGGVVAAWGELKPARTGVMARSAAGTWSEPVWLNGSGLAAVATGADGTTAVARMKFGRGEIVVATAEGGS